MRLSKIFYAIDLFKEQVNIVTQRVKKTLPQFCLR